MRKALVSGLTALMVATGVGGALAGAAHAGDEIKNGVTPYGYYCRGPYGVCKKPLKVREAVSAMQGYFHKRGFTVQVLEHRGRFIKADIFQDKKKVDCIIFDKKTGRIRSIY